MSKNIYVVSSGGCGSWCLVRYLKAIGHKTFHIHNRIPPTKLKNPANERFGDVELTEEELENSIVIFLFRVNIDNTIFSRFVERNWKQHLKHIQCPDKNACLENLLETKKDVFGLEDFYENWTTQDTKRNYKIYAIKYETMFENIDIISDTIGIIKTRHSMSKRETPRPKFDIYRSQLREVYKDFIEKMDRQPPIQII
tara:strand:- start:3131 stop:3724 length:594 start_codon:yes stop_codon:yes gene_type:complete